MLWSVSASSSPRVGAAGLQHLFVQPLRLAVLAAIRVKTGQVLHGLERVGVVGPQLRLTNGHGAFHVFLRCGIVAHRPVRPADREANRRLCPLLARKPRFEPLGGPIEQLTHRDVPVPLVARGLVADVGLAEQVLLQEVVDGLGDRPLLVSPLLLGLNLCQPVGREL